MENSRNFVAHKFESSRVEETAEIKWYALNGLNRNDYVNMITRSEMIMHDSWYTGGFVDIEEGFFSETSAKRDMPYNQPFQNAITYEMTLTEVQYTRTVYNTLEFISEMGGLFSAFSRFCLLIIAGLNY